MKGRPLTVHLDSQRHNRHKSKGVQMSQIVVAKRITTINHTSNTGAPEPQETKQRQVFFATRFLLLLGWRPSLLGWRPLLETKRKEKKERSLL